MFDYVDAVAYTNDQGARAQKLFAAVVLAALDDAIADDKKYGNGPEVIARWARRATARNFAIARLLPTMTEGGPSSTASHWSIASRAC